MSEKVKGDIRVLTLLLLLKQARKPLSKQDIFELIPAYGKTGATGDRYFQRDKDTLKSLGINLQVKKLSQTDYYYELNLADTTELHFNRSEQRLLRSAAQVWMDAENFAGAERIFRNKVLAHTSKASFTLETKLGGLDNALALLEAITDKTHVKFTYQKLTDETEQPRHVIPLVVFYEANALYLLSFDVDKQASRIFHLERIRNLNVDSPVTPPQLEQAWQVLETEQQILEGGLKKYQPLLLVSEKARAQVSFWQVSPEDTSGWEQSSSTSPIPGYSYFLGEAASMHTWLERAFKMGAEMIIVEPAELAERVKYLATEFLSRTEKSDC